VGRGALRPDGAAFPAGLRPAPEPRRPGGADLERTLADQVITDRARMKRAVRTFFRLVQKLPDRIFGYFQAPHTKYASSTI
jgi:hypothetical protein